jgi:rhodanese-related sulfurtransferase
VVVLTVLAAVLAGLANSVGPRAIPWVEDWTARTAAKAGALEKKAAEYGLVVLNLEQTRAAVEGGTHLLFDARKGELYDQGRLPGALSLPLVRFAEAFVEVHPILRPEDALLVYCSGKECDESLELGRRLREQGYANVSVYLGGFDEWKAAGGAVE